MAIDMAILTGAGKMLGAALKDLDFLRAEVPVTVKGIARVRIGEIIIEAEINIDTRPKLGLKGKTERGAN